MLARLQLLWLLIGSIAAASLGRQGGHQCEPGRRICYGAQGNEIFKMDIEEIKFVASWFRRMGRKHGIWLSMPPDSTCVEWVLDTPSRNMTVWAKHVRPRMGSRVTFQDIANTIDGGRHASEDAKRRSLLGCGAYGGSSGVKVNLTAAAYKSETFKKSKSRAKGIVLKIVPGRPGPRS